MSNEKQPTLIHYNNDWTDEMGFMTGAFEFLKSLPSSNQTFYGVRFNGTNPEMFVMNRRDYGMGDTIVPYDIELTQQDGTYVIMDPASVRVYESRINRKLLNRWRLFLDDSAPLWRREVETKVIHHDNLECVPAFVNVYIPQACRILVKMWRLVNDATPGPNVPDYDNLARKIRDKILSELGPLHAWQNVATTPELEALYHSLSSSYYHESARIGGRISGTELHREEIRYILAIREELKSLIKIHGNR